MARPRQFTERDALDRAMATFWHHGYDATSVQDLVDATGLNRGSLYGAFGDKHGLFLRTLDHYTETVVAPWLGVLEAEGTGLAAIRRFFGLLVASAAGDRARRGCLMTNTALELGAVDEVVGGRVARHYDAIVRALGTALDRARAMGELAPAADIESLADFLACLTQGILVLARMAPQRDAIGRVAAEALAHPAFWKI